MVLYRFGKMFGNGQIFLRIHNAWKNKQFSISLKKKKKIRRRKR